MMCMCACPLVIKCFGELRRKRRQKATKLFEMDKMHCMSKNFSFRSTWSNLVVPVGFQSTHFFHKNPFTRFFVYYEQLFVLFTRSLFHAYVCVYY